MRSLSCFSAAILGGKLTSTRSRDSAETPWGLTRLATWRFLTKTMVRPDVVSAVSSQLRESIQIISQKRITYPSTPLLFVIAETGVEIALQMAVLL